MSAEEQQWWYVPITIVEYGRKARIQATSAKDAVERVRAGVNWESCTDASRYKVTIARGKVEREDE